MVWFFFRLLSEIFWFATQRTGDSRNASLPRFQVVAPHLIRDPLYVAWSSGVMGIGYFGRGCAIQTSIAATSTQCITKKGRCARGTLSANHLWPRLEIPLCWRGWGTPRKYIKPMRYLELCALAQPYYKRCVSLDERFLNSVHRYDGGSSSFLPSTCSFTGVTSY